MCGWKGVMILCLSALVPLILCLCFCVLALVLACLLVWLVFRMRACLIVPVLWGRFRLHHGQHCVFPCYFPQDEISQLLAVETGGPGVFSSSSIAVTALEWANKYCIDLERESYCDGLRATTIPGTAPYHGIMHSPQ